MPDDEDSSVTFPPRRRQADQGLAKLVVPGLISLCFMLVGAGILGAVAMSARLTRLEAARMVSPEDVVGLRVELNNLKERGREIHDDHQKELDRLRDWMRRHSHGGSVPPPAEQPAQP
jgi:hypothetical protein